MLRMFLPLRDLSKAPITFPAWYIKFLALPDIGKLHVYFMDIYVFCIFFSPPSLSVQFPLFLAPISPESPSPSHSP